MGSEMCIRDRHTYIYRYIHTYIRRCQRQPQKPHPDDTLRQLLCACASEPTAVRNAGFPVSTISSQENIIVSHRKPARQMCVCVCACVCYHFSNKICPEREARREGGKRECDGACGGGHESLGLRETRREGDKRAEERAQKQVRSDQASGRNR